MDALQDDGVVLDGNVSGRRQSGLSSLPLTESPELARYAMHHYLHRKHAALVPPVSAAIRHLLATGELQRTAEHFERVAMTLSAEQFD